jgi:hypothetical protein
MLVQQLAGGDVKWAQLPVYWGAELLAGVVAAFVYGAISRTAADTAAVAEPQSIGETPVPVSPEGGPPATVLSSSSTRHTEPADGHRSHR